MVRHNPLLLGIIARAHGARYPGIVAERIASDCPDIPAAIAAMRERLPLLFADYSVTLTVSGRG